MRIKAFAVRRHRRPQRRACSSRCGSENRADAAAGNCYASAQGPVGADDLPISDVRACDSCAADGARHGRALLAQTGRNRADPAADRRLGGVRRKPGAGRRAMAYSGSGAILSVHGNSLDHPVETVGEMDRDRLVSDAIHGPSIETTVLAGYITDRMTQASDPLSPARRAAPDARRARSARARRCGAPIRARRSGVGLLGLVVAVGDRRRRLSRSADSDRRAAAPARAAAADRAPLAPEQALKVNAEIPVATGPIRPPPPFVFKGNAAARAQALNCLASAVYYEAGNQDDGRRARGRPGRAQPRPPSRLPGQRLRRRLSRARRAPTGCQFTFTCDGSLNRQPDADGWRRATAVAAGRRSPARSMRRSAGRPIITPIMSSPTGPRPWPRTPSSARISSIAGPAAGASRRPSPRPMRGHEPNAAALRTAALAVPHVAPSYGQDQLAEAIKEIPGAEPLKLAPSLRGDKRVAVRFNLAARKASDEATHQDYAKKFEASDNLKWSLSSDTVADNQQPLGKPRCGVRPHRRRIRRISAALAFAAATRRRIAAPAPVPPAAGSGRAGRRSRENRPTKPSRRSTCVRSPQSR